jgi:hypothetical protein
MPDADVFESALDEVLREIWSRPREMFGEPSAELVQRLSDMRLVYADWLEERGEPMAQVQRWLVRERKFPRYAGPVQDTWDWWTYGDEADSKPEDLPRDVWKRLPGAPAGIPPDYKEYVSRRAAERSLLKALLLLDKLDFLI